MNKPYILVHILFVIINIIVVDLAFAQPKEVHKKEFEPWESSTKIDVEIPISFVFANSDSEETESEGEIFEYYWKLWSNHFTKVDGPRSQLRPSTSRFALEAIRKYGLIKGSIISADRWTRSHSQISADDYPYDENGYFYDPVESNMSF